MHRYILSLLITLGVLSASGQATRMLTADKNNEYGIVYSLPDTEVQLDITATFTRRVAGPFREYAPRYLGNVDVIAADARSVSIDGVKLATVGRPSEEKYLMTLKPGALTEVCVDADGMLLAINTEAPAPKERAVEAPAGEAEPDMDEYLQYVDEDFLVSLSDATKARMLARTIMDIRESRLSLSRGTAETMPTDGRQLELMLQSLEQQENALMRAFTGYEYTTRETRRISLMPDSASLTGDPIVIARISADEKFVGSDNLIGEPIYLSFSNLIEPELPLNAKGEPKALPKDAVIYAIPANVDLKVDFDGHTLLSETIEIAQNGITFGLDPKLFTDKRQPSMALFNPATGALVKIAAISAAGE